VIFHSVNEPLSGVYTGVKTINTFRWQLRFETDFSILKLHCSAKSPTHIACVNEPLMTLFHFENKLMLGTFLGSFPWSRMFREPSRKRCP
jgi:hypothetical protein